LRERNVIVTAAPLFTDRYLARLYAGRRSITAIIGAYIRRVMALAHVYKYNLVWVEKELLPWMPALGEELLARVRIPFIVDYDDAIFHRYDLHDSVFVRKVLRAKIDKIMRAAQIVIVGNRYLAERAGSAGARRIVIIPTAVDISKYPATPSEPSNVLRIGWIGTPTSAKYLHLIREALIEAHRAVPLKLIVVGGGVTHYEGVPTEVRPWTEASEASAISDFHVGVMPLTDGPWERGKCGYKLIQYMACARAVIASPVGVNIDLVRHGENGFLAKTTSEWAAAVLAMGADPRARHEMGLVGRVRVERDYSTEINGPKLLDALRSAAST
jgi:glycosyltransferase involved in cell wall biosynthesis